MAGGRPNRLARRRVFDTLVTVVRDAPSDYPTSHGLPLSARSNGNHAPGSVHKRMWFLLYQNPVSEGLWEAAGEP